MLYLEVFVLPLDQVDGVNTDEHFLLCKSVLKELVYCYFRSVTEAVNKQIQNLGQELLVVQVLRVRVEPVIYQVLCHTVRS